MENIMAEAARVLGVEGPLTPEDLGLDERASDFVQKLPPEQMQDILQKVHADSTIRSPSAMVTKLAKEALAASEAGPGSTGTMLTPEQFGLDERSCDFVRQLPLQQMQEILEKLQGNMDTIRSPSAFVTRMAKEAHEANRANDKMMAAQQQSQWMPPQAAVHRADYGADTAGGYGGGYGSAPQWAPQSQQWGAPQSQQAQQWLTPEQFGLDDGASDFLRKLPPQRRQDILMRLENERHTIRSPSAFATKLAKQAMDDIERNGGVLQPEMFGLDERCSDFVRRLPHHQVQEILTRLQAEWATIHSPSAFVTRMVKTMVDGGSPSGSPAPLPSVDRIDRSPVWASVSYSGKGPGQQATASHGGKGLGQQVMSHASQAPPGLAAASALSPEALGVDAEAADFLYKLPPHRMQEILQELQAKGDSVRSPSAFVTKLAKAVQVEQSQTVIPSPRYSPWTAPRQEVGMPPRHDLGMTPRQDFGMAPRQAISVPARQDLGMAPRQDLGVAPRQDLSMAPRQDLGMARLSPDQFNLDGDATDFLSKLPTATTQEILVTLHNSAGTIRSPSAFVTRMAKAALTRAGVALPDGRVKKMLAPENFGLDQNAADFVRQLPPAEMQEVLEKLQAEFDTLRSPSAFVTRLVKEKLQSARSAAPAYRMPPLQAPRPGPASRRPPMMPDQFGLDESATNFLQKLPPPQMQEILQQLTEQWDTIRSPSAFVTKLAKQAMDGRSGARYAPY